MTSEKKIAKSKNLEKIEIFVTARHARVKIQSQSPKDFQTQLAKIQQTI